MTTEVRNTKINFFVVPVLSLVLAYALFPLAWEIVRWAVFFYTDRPSQIWMIYRQHGCLMQAFVGPFFLVATLLVTTGIVYVTRYFNVLIVLARRIAQYEGSHTPSAKIFGTRGV